jgi:hypothetical protein
MGVNSILAPFMRQAETCKRMKYSFHADPDADVSRPTATSVATLGSLSQTQQRAATTPAKLPIVRHCASSRSTGNHGP